MPNSLDQAGTGDGHHPVVPLEAPHVDPRGEIQPLVDGEFKSAQLITSVRGALRANHYHRSDAHVMYVVSGSFDYYWRAAGSDEEPSKITVGPGQLVATPAQIEHALIFHEDTTFVNFSTNERDQASYEADIVRTELVSPPDPPA